MPQVSVLDKVEVGSSSVGSSTGVDPRQVFITEALKHVGSGGHAWVQSMTRIGNGLWCAATQCAIAKTVGFAGINMPGTTYGAGRFGYEVVTKYGGQRIEGGPSANPQPGDFAEFPGKSQSCKNLPQEYWSTHIGVVERVEGNSVYIIDGNGGTGGQEGRGSYRHKAHNKRNIAWYARPDWTKVGGIASYDYSGMDAATYATGVALYSTSSTRADATIREVGYLNRSYEPSITSSDVKLSVVNYTGPLAEFVYSFGAPTVPGFDVGYGSPDNIDALPTTPRQIVQLLTERGLNTAAAIGVVANIRGESNFNLSVVGDHGTSFGLCQWHNERGRKMKEMCGGGDAWKTNLSGQIDYLWYELNSSYKKSVLDPLMSVSNTETGALEATDVFVRKFEIPADKDGASRRRQKFASEYWAMIIVNSNTNSYYSADTGNDLLDQLRSDTSSTTTEPTKVESTGIFNASIANRYPKKSVNVPKILDGKLTKQKGVCALYEDYSKFAENCTEFSAKQLADGWKAQGKLKQVSAHRVATYGGYYLIALRPRFGNIGDLVQILLEGSYTLNCIIADNIYGQDRQTKWGVPMGDEVVIIKWMYVPGDFIKDVKSLRSALNMESTGVQRTKEFTEFNKALKLWGILDKKVKKIVNYGSYRR